MSKVTVKTGDRPFLQEIESRGHRWLADEPGHLGGGDEGPSPYQLLLGALGACTTITTQMYARRKKWPLESMKVEMEHSRVHARDCEACESSEGFVDLIDMRVILSGELSEEQRARLFEISGKCPVKRTLRGRVHVQPSLVR